MSVISSARSASAAAGASATSTRYCPPPAELDAGFHAAPDGVTTRGVRYEQDTDRYLAPMFDIPDRLLV